MLVAIGIKQVRTIIIVHEQRINRSHVAGYIEGVGIEVTSCVVVEIAGSISTTQVHTSLEPVVRGEVGVQTASETLIGAGIDVTLLVGITSRSIYIIFLATSVAREAVVLAITRALNVLFPIQIVVTGKNLSNQLAIGIKQLVVGSIVDVLFNIVTNQIFSSIVSSSIGIKTHASVHGVVPHSDPRSLHPLVGIHAVILGDTTLVHTLVDADSHGGLVGVATLLGGNQHNTVGCTVSIQGCRSGVLEDAHALDVDGVDLGDVAIKGNAINNIERSTRTGDATDTADADVGGCTRLTVGIVHLDTRGTTLESGSYRRTDAVLDFLLIHNRDRTGN